MYKEDELNQLITKIFNKIESRTDYVFSEEDRELTFNNNIHNEKNYLDFKRDYRTFMIYTRCFFCGNVFKRTRRNFVDYPEKDKNLCLTCKHYIPDPYDNNTTLESITEYHLHHTNKETGEYFGIKNIKNYFKSIGYKRPKRFSRNVINQKHREIYKDSDRVKEINQKRRETMLDKYGVSHQMYLDKTKEKMKETSMKRFGVENPMQAIEVQEKAQKTNLDKYGVPYTFQAEEVKDKIKSTNLERFGVENPVHSEEVRNKISATNLEKYGAEFPFQSDIVQQKIRDQYLTGIPQQKCHDTKTKNGTHNSSSLEDQVYLMLKDRFNEVKRQYRSEEYPFNCDFYISDISLYIECDFHWTHMGELFTGSPEQLVKLEELESRIERSQYYKSAIITWTEKDVQKAKVAIDNNARLLIFYNIQEVEDFLELNAEEMEDFILKQNTDRMIKLTKEQQDDVISRTFHRGL